MIDLDGPDESDIICDICGRAMNDSPNVFDYGPATENDWNGETGNHIGCEDLQRRGFTFSEGHWK